MPSKSRNVRASRLGSWLTSGRVGLRAWYFGQCQEFSLENLVEITLLFQCVLSEALLFQIAGGLDGFHVRLLCCMSKKILHAPGCRERKWRACACGWTTVTNASRLSQSSSLLCQHQNTGRFEKRGAFFLHERERAMSWLTCGGPRRPPRLWYLFVICSISSLMYASRETLRICICQSRSEPPCSFHPIVRGWDTHMRSIPDRESKATGRRGAPRWQQLL